MNLPEFVIECLCQTFARLTKLSWFDFRPGDAAGILTGRRQSGGDSNDSSSVSEAFVFRRSVDEIIKMVQVSGEVAFFSAPISSCKSGGFHHLISF